uniref:NAD(P)(+)--arginine ADP-ribosyltransferase n=1 Tax=Strigops habroptila TaxID=2489341 RepID=A0A672V195_STRHB
VSRLVLGLVLLAGPPAVGSPLYQRGLSPIKEVAMDMAPNSFDDQYEGCSHMMEEELPELNRTEFLTNSIYAKAWTRAAEEWRKQQHHVPMPPGLRSEHAVALMAYTTERYLFEAFNMAVREAGRSRQEYLHVFQFKTLHFLLSQALRTLRSAETHCRCHRVYRGVRNISFTAQPNQSVRFGHFTSTSISKEISKNFGNDTTFTVETCCGALIRDFSFFRSEEEILIPPSEIFQVTNFTRAGQRSLIQLRSQGAKSNFNCELVKGANPMGWGGCSLPPGSSSKGLWTRDGGTGQGEWL